jgi:hypothetical protein
MYTDVGSKLRRLLSKVAATKIAYPAIQLKLSLIVSHYSHASEDWEIAISHIRGHQSIGIVA